eukprot:TRINITY_DN1519_c0_g2_i1.p2 TRINITY_DN1519_c0_g2~~TRINITY_DN1519_c0_g2_i1.p2  ORF type:complete len:101 (+),score=4.13 TRINITY_DN1519_c0_g2_i1:83-385(+)
MGRALEECMAGLSVHEPWWPMHAQELLCKRGPLCHTSKAGSGKPLIITLQSGSAREQLWRNLAEPDGKYSDASLRKDHRTTDVERFETCCRSHRTAVKGN